MIYAVTAGSRHFFASLDIISPAKRITATVKSICIVYSENYI